jgi:hypothetical protein
MTLKYRYSKLIFCLLLLTVILSLPRCGSGKRGTDAENLNLLAGNLEFRFKENAEARFQQLVTETDQAKYFKQSHINSFFKKNKWIGRIKDNDVSYHALYAVDDSKISYSSRSFNADGLLFSIFQPENSSLTYSIQIETANGKEKVFEKTFTGKAFFDADIPLKMPKGSDFKILLETAGSGAGAWINPRLHRPTSKPRVFIVIVLDTLRRDHTSVYGYPRPTTPFLEKLAADGVTYNHAFSTTSWTLPAHVSLFSGKDLSEHGVVSPGDTIPDNVPMVAEVFQNNGFVTAAFTGGGFVEDSYGFYRGFQYYSNVPGNVFSMNSAERVFSHFKNYIQKYWGNDLFIFLHTYQVHAPYKAPRAYIDKIKDNVDGNLLGIGRYIKNKNEYYKAIDENDRQRLMDLYDGSIRYCDEVLLGNVIGFLKEKKLYDESMVAVLSDHGEEFYDHGSWEHGHTLYNELIKIPLVIKYPVNSSITPTGKRNGVENGLTSISDIPGIFLKEGGLWREDLSFNVRVGEPGRVLPVLFPVSPIIQEFLSKVSFVDDRFHFIYNQLDKKKIAFFNPAPPKISPYELYKREDLQETLNLYKKHPRAILQFKKLVKEYLNKLKHLKRKNKKLDKDLEEKLKSLGYLGN